MPRPAKLTYAQKKCVTTTGLLMQRAGMLRPQARVGVAVSGGVDSLALLKTLTIRQAIVPFPFELMVLHVNPGFTPDNHLPLVGFVRELGLAAHIEMSDHGPRAHSEENTKNSTCFYCSLLRRKRLFELCRVYGLTHLALGHTADDLVTTFFMNILQNGRVEALSPCEPFFKGRLMMIRPALFLEKSLIKTAARQWGLPVFESDCPSKGATRRDSIWAWLSGQWAGNRRIKNNVFNALRRYQLGLTLQGLSSREAENEIREGDDHATRNP
jgi:tRNA(Ile)-lysidine synthase TilS/MesJ